MVNKVINGYKKLFLIYTKNENEFNEVSHVDRHFFASNLSFPL